MDNRISLKTRALGIFVALLVPLVTAPIPLSAATYYWDADGSVVGDNAMLGTGLGGAGTWDTTSPLWYNGVNTDVAWPNATTDTAAFTGTAGTVTLAAGGVSTGSLQFASTGYALSGGAVTLGASGSNVILGSGITATINSAIAGTNGLGVFGPGTLNLTGLNTYTGNTSISNGATLNLNFATNTTDIINNSSPLVLNGGTLKLSGVIGATDSQTFASTSVTGGGVITLTQNSATSLTAALGAITQTTGGTLNFSVVPLTTGVIATTSNANVNGILGPWATVGALTNTLKYATVNASNQIVAYTGTAAATAANLTDTTGFVNYDLASATGTVAASVSANTIRYTGAAATTAPGATLFSVNGLMNAGTGLWTIGANNLTIGANKELVVNLNASGITVTGTITDNASGPSGLTLASTSTGTLTISKVASYTGPTTINSGTLALGIANALSSSTAVKINGGTLATSTFADSIASLSLKNGSITGTGILTSGTDFDLQSGSVSAVLAGAVGLTKTTPGTVTLSNAANTYTGTTTVTQGVLSFSGTPVVTTSSALGNSTSNIVLGGTTTMGTLVYTGASATLSRNFTINAGGGEIDSTTGTLTIIPGGVLTASTLTIAPNGPLTFGGANNITLGGGTANVPLISGTNALNKVGTGTLTLSTLGGIAAIQSAMPINIQGGSLAVVTTQSSTTNPLGTGAISITPSATLSFSNSGATFTLPNTITIPNGTGTATLTSSGTVNSSGAINFAAGTSVPTLQIRNTSSSSFATNVSGAISGTGNIQLNGTAAGSTVTLSGAQNQTGSITNISAVGVPTTTLSGTIGSSITGIAQAGGNAFNVTSAIPLNASMNTFTSSGAGLWTMSGGITGAQPLTFNANSTGSITVATGAVNNAGTLTNSGTGNGTTTISSNIGSNVTNVTQNAANSPLVLSGTNTYTGTTTVTAGILDFTTSLAIPGYSTSPATAFGTYASPRITVASGGTLVLPFGGANSVTATDIANMFNGTYNVFGAGSSFGLDTTNASPSPAVLSSAITDPGGTVGIMNFTKSGTNALTVGSANTYTGWTAIVNGTLNASIINSVNGGTPAFAASSLGAPTTVANGTIRLGAGSMTGTLSYTGTGETTDRVFDLAGGTGGGGIDNSGTGLLTIASPITYSGAGAKTLTLSGSNNILVSNAITGGLSASTTPLTINKAGAGTVTLSGANTAQNLTISGGTLDTGAGGLTLSNGSATTINGNGVAGASATINGKLNLAGVGGAANGADVGSTIAGFTLNINAIISGGATNNIDFYSAGTTVLTGANTYQGQTQINGTTLQVSSINSVSGGSASSNLGAPTTVANGTILMNTGGTLKYVGTGETTDRIISLSGTTSGATIDQSGTGLLKFSTNFATPGAGTKTLVLQGSTAGTGEIAGVILNNSATNLTNVTKAGSGTWTLSGANTYTGATTVNGGNLILSTGAGSGTLGNTAITINSGGTFSPLANTVAGNTAAGTAGAKLTLNSGGTLNLADGTVGNFTVNQQASFVAATVGNFAGGALNFDLSSTAVDQILFPSTVGTVTSSGSNLISINPVSSTLTAGNYTLISSAAAGSNLSNTNFYLASPNLNVGGTLYTLTLSGTSGTEVLTVAVNPGAAITPGTAFWNGTSSASWAYQPGGDGTATNWSAAAAGTPDTFALPGSDTNVYFTSNTATNLSTTLDQNTTINSLIFTGASTANSAGATIASGGAGTNTLTINAAAVNGNTAGNGITVNAGAGADTISAGVILGASQTWTNNSTSALTVSGVIGDGGSNFNLTKAGTGTIALTNAANTYGGITTINGGTLSVATLANGGAASSIGQSSSAATNLVFGGTGSLQYTGASVVSDRNFTINAGVVGTIDVTQAGTTLELAGVTGAVTTGALTKLGLGTLTLSGAQTYTGNTLVNNGTLNIDGGWTGLAGSSKLQQGTVAGTSVVNVSSNITAFSTAGGSVAGAVSAYNQTAGTVTYSPGNGNAQFVGGTGGYGYFNLTGGTYQTAGTNSRFNVGYGTAGTGVAYIGGTGILNVGTTNGAVGGEYVLIAYNGTGALGQMTVGPGGTVLHNGAANKFAIEWTSTNNYGVLNVAGGNVSSDTQAFYFGATSNTGAVGIINLASGTMSTNVAIGSGRAAGGSGGDYINFAGGTINTGASVTALIPINANVPTTATIFGPITNSTATGINSQVSTTQDFTGGAVFNVATGITTVTAILRGATGYGITQSDISIPTTGNSGYIGAPAVVFSAPAAGGVPASGYALISGGKVTGIVITSPGTYAQNETPTITFTGGGGSIAAFNTSALATANSTAGGVTKTGTGTLTLSGANTFSGVVDIKGGLLSVTSLTNGGVAGPLGMSSNAASNVLLDGGILGYSGTVAGTTDRNFTLAASNGGLDASGTSAGTFTLTAANSITVAPNLGAANLILQGTGASTTGSGFLGSLIADGSGTTVSVVKNGTGTWNITNNANTYTGATTINGGILSVSTLGLAGAGGTPSPLGASSNAASNLVLSGGTLRYTGTGETTDRNFTFGNATTAAGGGIDTTGATGPLIIDGSMTAVNPTGANQTLTLTALPASGANAINGNIVDSSGTALTGITKAGAGAWTLAGANAYTGTTTVNAGTLNITGTNINASPITFVSGGGGVVNINSSGTVNAGTVTWSGATAGVLNLNSGTLLENGGGLNSSSSTANALNFNGGTLKSGAPFPISGNLNITIQSGGGTVDTSGGSITSSSTFGNTASPGTLNVIGGNTLQTPVGATMTGPVNITGAGTTLRLTTTAAAYTGLWTVGTGANLDINNVGNFSFGGLAGGGTVLDTAASAVRTITITGAGGNTFSGAITQPSPSTTSATGVTLNLSTPTAIQTFSGANTYGGPTTITTGTLALNGGGSLGDTAISVAANGTLAALGTNPIAGTTGAGTFGASLNVSSGGTLTMVDGGIGVFNLNQNTSFATAGLTLSNAILNMELSSSGVDQLLVSGGAINSAITGTNTINITGLGTTLTAGTYNLITAPGIAAGNTLFRFSNGTATDSIVVGASTYSLTLSSVAGIEQLIVGAPITNMIWTGQTNGNGATNSVWTATPAANNNFAVTTPAAVDYADGAAVTFQDQNLITASNVTNSVVTIDTAGVQPGLVTVNNSAVNYTFQNDSGSIGIAGATALTKSGSGTLTLLGQNTYTGATEINGGIVNVGVAEGSGAGPLGNGGLISFGGGTLQYSAANTADYSARFSNAANNLISIDTNGQNVSYATPLTSPGGTLTKLGTGTLTLNGVNTYSGNTTVNGGTLSVTGFNGALGALASPTITVNAGGTLDLTNGDTLGYTVGRNALVINGGTVLNNVAGKRDTLINTVTMTGGFLAGTSTGDTASGAFSLANGTTAVLATSDAAGNPATISANVSTQAVAVFQVNRGTGAVAPGAPDLLISGSITPYSAGTNGVTFKGSGITTLTGANTYKGNTTILGGTLGGIVNANSTQALGNNTAGLIMGDTTGNFGTLNVNANNSITTLNVNTSNTTAGQNINTINIAAGTTLTNTGAVTVGAGAATTNYTNLTVTGDTWKIGSATTPTNANVQLGVNATTNISNAATLDLTGLSTFYANLGSGTLMVGEAANANGTGTAGSTLKLAPTSTILATTISSDSPDGNVTQAIKLGTIANVLQANTINIGGTASGRALGTLDFLSSTGTVKIRNLAGTGGATMNVAAGATGTGFGPAGTVDFSGHSADLLFSTLSVAGRSAGSSGSSTGTFKFDTGTLNATTVTVASRTGSTQTTGTITGELDLNQAAGTTGVVTIGTLNTGINSATTATSSGAAIATVNIGGSGTVGITTWNMGQDSTTPGATGQFTGGPLQVTTNITGSTTTIGTLNMNTDSSSATGTSKTSTVTMNISAGTVNVGAGGISMANASNANAAATSTINITGSSTVNLSGNITRAGGVGTETTNLNLNGPTALLDMSGGGTVHNIGSATAAINNFTYTDGTLQNIGTVYGGITLAGTGERVFNETGTFRGQVNGVITDSGQGINKTGTGTIALLGANTYSGTTDVNAGTLLVNGSNSGSGAVNVTNAGSVLGGIGSIAGTVTVNSDASINPGDPNSNAGVGTLTVKALTLNAGSLLGFDLSTPSSSDKIIVSNGSNTLSLAGASAFQFNNAGVATAGVYTLIDYNGTALTGAEFANLSIATTTVGSNNLTATLVNNSAGTSVDLDLKALRTWTGAGTDGGLWNLTSNGNWTPGGVFFNGDSITFDDSAAGTTAVVLDNASGALTPASITFNNSTKDYSFTGSGSIAGTTGISKDGTGTVTLGTANTYTGPTTVNAGTLVVSNATGSGTGTGNVSVTGGTLQVGSGGVGSVSGNVTASSSTFTTPTTGSGVNALNAPVSNQIVVTGAPVVVGSGLIGGNVVLGTSSTSVAILSPGDNGGALNGVLSIGGNLAVADGSQFQLGLTSTTNHDSAFDWSTQSALAYLTGGSNYTSTWSTPLGNYDSVNITGSLNLGTGGTNYPTIMVSGNGFTATAGDIFKLVDWNTVGTPNSIAGTGGFNLATDLVLPTLGPGYSWDTSAFTTYGVVVVVPEPGRALLLASGLAALMMRRRRRAR